MDERVDRGSGVPRPSAATRRTPPPLARRTASTVARREPVAPRVRAGAPAPAAASGGTGTDGRIRVMVVDDSVVVRKLVVEVLAGDPGIEVVGTAANGKLALQKLDQLKPDVVTLDIEMPVMDGLETLTELRRRQPRLPVVMFSTLTERGASATLEALSRGASDYVTKPSNVDRIQEGMERVRLDLIPKVKALVARRIPSTAPLGVRAASLRTTPAVSPRATRTRAISGATAGARTPAAPRRTGPSGRVDVVAIGVSTGGPNALAALFAALPGDLPVPIVVVQHMPPVFTRLLAERLTARTSVRVHEATDGMVLEPGHGYLAPGDHHMVLRRSGTTVVAQLNQGPPENSCRPAVDPLFRSVAEVYGGNAAAVVLTGMGADGTQGAGVLRDAGARILAQDEETSVVWGMPGHVVNAGLADDVLPLESVAPWIVQQVRTGRPPQPLRAPRPARTR
jgi:two-component system, chemotaxis family, protein-glutamate methylesterase/glutaminase